MKQKEEILLQSQQKFLYWENSSPFFFEKFEWPKIYIRCSMVYLPESCSPLLVSNNTVYLVKIKVTEEKSFVRNKKVTNEKKGHCCGNVMR